MCLIPNPICLLCNLNVTKGYSEHVKECSEYLEALRKPQCPICDVNLSSSSDMMIHLKYKHFLASTEIKTEIKTEPGIVPRIKLPRRRCENCNEIMKRKGEGYYECLSCTRASLNLTDMDMETEDFDLTLNQNQDFDGETSGYNFCPNDARNSDIVIKTEFIQQNSDEDQINTIVNSADFDCISAVKTELGEPLQFPGKPRNSADIEVIDLNLEDNLSLEGVDDTNKLWCICRKPHKNRFMIACDICQEWFHGSCVGISPKKGKEMEDNGHEWTCPKCHEINSAPFPKKVTAKKSSKAHPQLPRIEQTRSLLVSPTLPQAAQEIQAQAPQEPETLKLRFFRCPMCNNPYREKSEVELHIIGTHNMTIDMLKTMVICGAIKIIEETFQ